MRWKSSLLAIREQYTSRVFKRSAKVANSKVANHMILLVWVTAKNDTSLFSLGSAPIY